MDYQFKFKKERVEDGWTLRPKIRAVLSYKNKSKEVITVLDTGSDLNYLPAEIAEYFELPLSEKVFTAQGAEQQFGYKTSKIYVKLDNPHKSFRKLLTVMVPVENALHKDIIFGTEFLKHFIVTLNYGKGTIKLSETTPKNKLR